MRIVEALKTAEDAGCDLALFPELAITGYPPEDLLHEPAFLHATEHACAQVVAATGSTVAIFGTLETGEQLFNAAIVARNGVVEGIWHKELLPNYGVFDERRWFTPGDGATPLFSIAGTRVAVTICEDAWSSAGPLVRQGSAGAEVVVTLNASPYRRDVLVERTEMLCARAREADATIVYVNLVGGQDELIFDGASMVVSPDGAVLSRLPQFMEQVEIVDLDLTAKAPADALVQVRHVSDPRDDLLETMYQATVVPSLDSVGEVYSALVLATHDYVSKNHFREIGVGLSGGIDSALVAAIAADALGAECVHGVAMPSRYSSEGSLSDAAALATNLGIDLRTIAIEAAHQALLDLLAPSFVGLAPNLAEENLQARVRGTLMMGLSNKLGWLILTTGNKSETAVGYATLYGDMAGGFAVIKDVPKLLVYALCEYRNQLAGFDLIPQASIDKPPSAELRPDQRDDDTLPPYPILDPILEGYIEDGRTIEELVGQGFDPAVCRRVFDLVDGAEYKRRQAPPGPRVTHRAFGKDRRMPIVNGFRASRGYGAEYE